MDTKPDDRKVKFESIKKQTEEALEILEKRNAAKRIGVAPHIIDRIAPRFNRRRISA